MNEVSKITGQALSSNSVQFIAGGEEKRWKVRVKER